jgi:pyridoxal phosphate enzyme (YggS family)
MVAMEQGEDSVARWRAVRAAIAKAAADCERPAEAVRLVAVAKTVAAADIWPVIAAGQRVFGENRVQEAKAKWPLLREQAAAELGTALELHLIGPLQSNKAKEAVALFDVIESVDRPKIAEALAAEIARQNRPIRLFIQVNTGEEPQKAGVGLAEADAFIDLCTQSLRLPVEGLMCIPPADQQASPHFAVLATLAHRHRLPHLSMGMSADFAVAIQLGATHVRVGSAIFGARHGPA